MQLKQLLNLPDHYRPYVEDAFKTGTLALSPLQNATKYKFRLKAYEHPYERLITDILTMDILVKIPRGAKIMDIGSKFNKIIDYMPHNEFDLVAIRPELLNTDR
jgi:hypothetical protein